MIHVPVTYCLHKASSSILVLRVKSLDVPAGCQQLEHVGMAVFPSGPKRRSSKVPFDVDVRAGREEDLDHVGVATLRCVYQCRTATWATVGINPRAGCQQQSDHVGMAFKGGVHQRRWAIVVGGIDLCAGCQQGLDPFQVTMRGGFKERSWLGG